jgi:uncharacterized membrane protein YjfL (UPF0719 family)
MEPRPLYLGAYGVVTTLALLTILRFAQKRPASEQERGAENPARALLHVGQMLAVFMVAAAAVKNCVQGESLLRDAAWVAAFSLVALLLLVVTGRIGIQLLMQSRLPHEIDRRNVAAGAAAGAHYVACGIVTAEAFGGNDVRGLLLSLAFYALAMVTLHLFVTLFRALTVYDDAEEIRGENLAAALSYGGLAIGVALIVGRALQGDFVSWSISLRAYAAALPIVFALYPVRQLFVQALLLGGRISLRGGKLDEAIQLRRSAGMGALEGTSYVATALAVTRLLA